MRFPINASLSRLAIAALTVTLAGCPSSDTGGGNRQFELLFKDRDNNLDHRVSLTLEGQTINMMPGETRRLEVAEGQSKTLKIEFHSPLMRCNLGQAGQEEQRLSDEFTDNQIVLGCEFVEFFDLSGGIFGDSFYSMSVLTDGTDAGTTVLPTQDAGNLLPVSTVSDGVILSAGDGYFTLNSTDMSLQPTVWNTENTRSRAVWKGNFFALVDRENGEVTIIHSPNPNTPASSYHELPVPDENCQYNDILADDDYVTVLCSTDGVTHQKIVSIDRSTPVARQEIVVGDATLNIRFPNLGQFGARTDESTGTAEVFSLMGDTNNILTHPIAESNVQSVRLRKLLDDTALIWVDYLSASDEACIAFYALTQAEGQQELVDLCDSDTGISVLLSPFALNGDVYMVAKSESGQVIPKTYSLIAVRAPGVPEVLVNGNELTGSISDVLPTESGIYLHTKEDTQVGCPLGPWACTYKSRLYTVGFSGATPAEKVFEGLYLSTLFSYRSLVSSPWSMSGQVLFLAATPEAGAELWRSDGTEEGTYMVRDLFPDQKSIFIARSMPLSGIEKYAPR